MQRCNHIRKKLSNIFMPFYRVYLRRPRYKDSRPGPFSIRQIEWHKYFAEKIFSKRCWLVECSFYVNV